MRFFLGSHAPCPRSLLDSLHRQDDNAVVMSALRIQRWPYSRRLESVGEQIAICTPGTVLFRPCTLFLALEDHSFHSGFGIVGIINGKVPRLPISYSTPIAFPFCPLPHCLDRRCALSLWQVMPDCSTSVVTRTSSDNGGGYLADSTLDLLRKRMRLVQHRTAHIVSVLNTITRNTGSSLSWSKIEAMTDDQVSHLLGDGLLGMAPRASLEIIKSLDQEISKIEKTAKARAKLRSEFELLKTVWGVGTILALTIMYETGEISRFSQVGDYCSYAR